MANKKKDVLLKITQKNTLRSPETKDKYVEFIRKNKKKNCIYCDRELFVKEFKYWMILENRFPYDGIAQISHMLAPKRHVAEEKELTVNEINELRDIKEKKLRKYDVIVESPSHASSKPDHYHVHLLRYYRNK